MTLSDILRKGNIEQVKALADIPWLEDQGFWTLAGKLFERLETQLRNRLEQEANTRDEDMFLKGQLRSLKNVKYQLNKLITDLKSKAGQ